MSQEFPPRRNLESLKKEAKRWFAALQAGDPEARAPLARALSNAPATSTLRDVQHALSREHGFAGWMLLKEAIEKRSAEIGDAGAKALALYESKADALLESLIVTYCRDTTDAATEHTRGLRNLTSYSQRLRDDH